ncbi:MAG: right-handed parallel beta-helix repeat-containing protein [Gemmatales bacterium]|nr:right-handed parallel beta-helix repeat-containing protein [Gemmatales bacterium]
MNTPTGRQPPGSGKPSQDKKSSPSVSPSSATNKTAGEKPATIENIAAGDGQLFGQYRVVAKLGQGGMGVVYRAVHVHLNRPVALKILPADRLQNPDMLARFQREMRAAGSIEHPHIVRALDAGQVGKVHYLAMEFVDGLDTAKILKKVGPLPVPEACEIIRQAALGLQAIHAQGMVHRDIKPGNLMLARQPAGPPIVKILDLGLARLNDSAVGDQQLTQGNVILGTLEFIAPEQAARQTVDIRADIYSLGATFYALLAGKPPFSGPEYDSILSKLRALAVEDPTPIEHIRTDVPPALAEILARMLAKDPNQRFHTPQEVADALLPFCADANLAPLLEGRLPPRDSTQHVSTPTGISFWEDSGQRLRQPPRQALPPWLIPASAVAIALFVAGVVLLAVFALYRSPKPSNDNAVQEATRRLNQSKPQEDRLLNPPAVTKPTSPASKPTPTSASPAKSSSTPRVWVIGQDVASLPEAVACASDGDTVALPPGAYQLTATFVISKRLTLCGENAEQTILRCSGVPVGLRITAPQVQLEKLTLEHLGHQPADLVQVESNHVVIRDCHFRKTKTPPPLGPHQFPPPIGFAIKIAPAASCRVRSCTFTDTERGAAFILHPAQAEFEANRVSGTWDGFLIHSASEVHLRRNHVENSHTAFSISEASCATVEDNEVVSCNNGISIRGNSSPTIISNRIRNNKLNGIIVVSGGFPKIENNICESNAQSGIHVVSKLAQPILAGNTCLRNLEHGISVLDGARPLLRKNRCQENKGYGIYVRQAEPLLEDEQTLLDNGQGPIFHDPGDGQSNKPNASSPVLPPEVPAHIRKWLVGKDVPNLEAALAQARPGDWIYLPAGDHQLPRGLVIAKAIHLRGEGRDKTRIVSTVPGQVLRFVGAGPWNVQDLTVEYTGSQPADVLRVESGVFSMLHCKVTGGRHQEGIGLGRGLAVIAAERITLRKCLFTNNGETGLTVEGPETCQVLCEECTFSNNRGSGACFINATAELKKCSAIANQCDGLVAGFHCKIHIADSYVSGNGWSGIGLWDGVQATVINCRSEKNSHDGICARKNSRLVAHGNQCVDNLWHGIRYQAEATGRCVKNTCSGNRHGIGLLHQSSPVVEDNTCTRNKEYGVICSEQTTAVIRSNLITHNVLAGIVVQDSAKPRISANQIAFNGTFGIVLTNQASPQITNDNQLLGNKQGPLGRL